MTQPVAAWRVSYTPGNWLVLAGPTMLVVMLPAPARASGLVNELWSDIVTAESVDGLLKLAGEVGLDSMPDFGAFFWDNRGLHALTRGRVRVIDTEDGSVALEGEGTLTWNEANLGAVRNLRIDLERVDDDEVLRLPLVVGAASVSAIQLTTDPDALIRFPSHEQFGVLSDSAVPAAGPEPVAGPAIDPEDERPANLEVVPEAVAVEVPDAVVEEPVPDPFAEESVPGAIAEEPVAEVPNALDDQAPDPTSSDSGPDDVAAVPEPIASTIVEEDGFPELRDGSGPDDSTDPGAMIAPAPEPAVEAPRPAPVVVPPTLGEVDDEGGTIFSTGLAATHKPAQQAEQALDPQVLAVPCSNGHANPPGARSCRICKAPVDSTNPRLIRRPLLAGVHTNKGEFFDVVAGIVIGRAPDGGSGPAGAFLLRVPSPGSDISRNHLLVTTRDWNVHITDLHSTNGTTVLPPGEQPFILHDGASVQVELGTVLDLGDGVSLRIEPPRG
ncbi:FHA domain protein [Tessaracoccus bendigoensis DSM 12906]|uniref:FHA domain protein n=1 Tax=Tessaracoccus bendigoensis DSM 12906 TaxID=1123357 RepID=A0A1M6J2Z3_9ACTN|nr:FHA domain-containing protein [Tessaracoccus bendigoensis]SHJ41022.1 FHA domain protein [Tessaracoccus bendigoensis DSM 12906]